MNGIEIARKLIAEEKEKKTGFLDLGNLGLEELPSEVLELVHLHELTLGIGYIRDQWQDSANNGEPNTICALPDLRRLASLSKISLICVRISDLEPLKGLASLESLNCAGTQVSNLEPLKGLASLESFNCWGTQVSNLEPLKGLASLERLDCAYTRVSNLEPLKGLNLLRICG